MPKNYKQIIDRLDKIRQALSDGSDAVIILQQDKDGTLYRMNDPDRKPFELSEVRPGCAIIIDDITKELKENKNHE